MGNIWEDESLISLLLEKNCHSNCSSLSGSFCRNIDILRAELVSHLFALKMYSLTEGPPSKRGSSSADSSLDTRTITWQSWDLWIQYCKDSPSHLPFPLRQLLSSALEVCLLKKYKWTREGPKWQRDYRCQQDTRRIVPSTPSNQKGLLIIATFIRSIVDIVFEEDKIIPPDENEVGSMIQLPSILDCTRYLMFLTKKRDWRHLLIIEMFPEMYCTLHHSVIISSVSGDGRFSPFVSRSLTSLHRSGERWAGSTTQEDMKRRKKVDEQKHQLRRRIKWTSTDLASDLWSPDDNDALWEESR